MPEDSSMLADLRRQFDAFPYPDQKTANRHSPKRAYFHAVQSAWWRVWRQDPARSSLTILDAGCGSGQTSLHLALANPESSVLGVDLSEKSIEIARARALRAGVTNVCFRCLSFDQLSQEGSQFDYINADEVMYLVPDPENTAVVLASLLKPKGILRANFHCAYQRAGWLRLQSFLDHLGLMSGEASEHRVATALEVVGALNPNLALAAKARNLSKASSQFVMSNLMLRGDKGFTFPQVFKILSAGSLQLASMLEWDCWDLQRIFADGSLLDESIASRLERMSLEESLTVVQLVSGQQRLLDFWAARIVDQPPVQAPELRLPGCTSFPLLLHPLAKTSPLRDALLGSVQMHRSFNVNTLWPVPQASPIIFDPVISALVLRLGQEVRTVGSFVEHFEAMTSRIQTPDGSGHESQLALQMLQSLEHIGMILIDRT